jgi:tetratricopeptide (TPR) repeat protein
MIRRIAVATGLVLLIVGWAIASPNPAELMTQGDQLYAKRSESFQDVRRAITKWDQAWAQDPRAIEPLCRIAMAYIFLGRFAPDAATTETSYRRSHEYAQRAVENDGKSGPAHFWWAISLARSVEDKSKFAKLAVMTDVTMHLRTAKSLSPGYFHGGPDRELGRLALRNPIPAAKLAIKHLQAAVAFDPGYVPNLVLLAEAFARDGQAAKAKKLAKKILTLKPEPGFAKELAKEKMSARKIIDGLSR